MNWLLVGALAAMGLAIGWCLRPVVYRYAVPAGNPPGRACPACGHQLLRPVARPPSASPQHQSPASRSVDPRWLAVLSSAAPRCLAVLSSAAPRWLAVLSSAAPRWLAALSSGDPRWLAALSSGRCPACRARAGPPPLAAELTTAVLFGALAARVHPGLVVAAACWLAAVAVALAWIDIAVQRLPDALTGPAYAGTVAFLLLAAATTGRWVDLLRAVIGGLALAAAYLMLAVVSRSALGLGDVKLAASLGTLAAWPGWPTLLAGAFAGFLLGAIYGIGLLVSRRAHLKQRIPFGPFMIAGTFLAVLASAAVGP